MTNITHPNRNQILAAVLATCLTQRLAAGMSRDGSAVARIDVVIAVLDAMAKTCSDLTSSRYLMIAAERDAARETRHYAVVHDRAARGELVGAEYGEVLKSVRERFGHHHAAVAALPEV
jgi:hypothetical protein